MLELVEAVCQGALGPQLVTGLERPLGSVVWTGPAVNLQSGPAFRGLRCARAARTGGYSHQAPRHAARVAEVTF